MRPIMTNQEVKNRIKLLQEPLWSFADIREALGINLANAQPSLFAQFRIWAERYENIVSLHSDQEIIHRELFELFLQNREWIGIKTAAYQMAMDESTLNEVLVQAASQNWITDHERDGEFPGLGILHLSLAKNFHKRFPGLNLIFASHSAYVERLHGAISEHLGIQVDALYCSGSKFVGDIPVDFAFDMDCITGEPVGLRQKITLNTKKFIRLRPDVCSAKTYVEHHDILQKHVSGMLPESLEPMLADTVQ